MIKVHLNWSHTKDWDDTRDKLQAKFRCAGFGNFMDFEVPNLSYLYHPRFKFEPRYQDSLGIEHYVVFDIEEMP